MVNRLKKPQILLALIIAFSVPILSGYLLYCDIAEDDPFSSEAQYENEDLDDAFLVSDCQNQLAFSRSIGLNPLFPVFLPDALFPVSFPEINVIEQVSRICSLSPYLERKLLVLRC